MKKLTLLLAGSFFLAVCYQYQATNATIKPFNPDPECPWCDTSTENQQDIYLPQDHRLLKMLAYSDPDYLADLLWMYTTLFYGKPSFDENKFLYLYYLIDDITFLAPDWDFPYFFAGIVFLESREFSENGLILLEKGTSRLPQDWTLWFLKGYHHWKNHNEIESAAKAFETASLQPGAPAYLASLPVTLLMDISNIEMAKELAERTIERIKEDTLKKSLHHKIEEIDARD